MAKILMLLSAIFLLVSPLVSGYRGMMVGGRTQVRDVKSNEAVQELGRFCVKEFNKQQLRQQHGGSNGGGGELLMFSEVVAAETQVVSGIKYYLKIAASNGKGEAKVFDSVVVVKAWIDDKQLITFEPAAANELRKFKK
ncbi:cysteine proteinase inhibitor 5 [Ricinus communis]|uniref:Cysteine proteinase inhibitor B, putative n=1 Tax=Ricinus communis TaxID=3988 RepID=B9RRK6_RICCO|nr:cysteine proteinase inhibitor 5 [Ricinus communis]EEF45992.1 Cysteine proteinase inhibitor B, putative [Ricinus communis]|eukprot:XP_002516375.1 cysteine proteinase inhibitor 5 [Ricinus communis]